MRVSILSRASDLARLQAMLVRDALTTHFPDLHVDLMTRSAAGDRDVATPLAAMPDKGAFTSDLSDALTAGAADLVVHSWKDLPLEDRPGLHVAATLERADPRDVLLVRRDVLPSAPATLNILSSSPRRSWLLERTLRELLPWRVESLAFQPVRGNIATRLTRLIEKRGDALVVAKAALDRLLAAPGQFEEAARHVRRCLDQCAWMVLPLRDVPGAPAQGALAIEVPIGSPFSRELDAICHRPTWDAVQRERAVLAAYGGGCHEALGATALPRDYGCVLSIQAARVVEGAPQPGWSLERPGTAPRTSSSEIWPRPDERNSQTRRSVEAAQPSGDAGLWIARAEALPQSWTIPASQIVWTAGGTTWRRLAARGVWVHGCADGLGDAEPPNVDALAGRAITWRRLTHRTAAAADPSALATYVVEETLPDNILDRTHFFWSSPTLFLQAVERWPELKSRSHGSGPGRTWQTIRRTLGSGADTRVWLDYDHWHREILV